MATIIRFIIRIFLSSRALFPLSLVGIYRRPRRILLPVPRTILYLSATSSLFHLSAYLLLSTCTHRRARGPVVSNRRFEFLNIFRLPAPLCPFTPPDLSSPTFLTYRPRLPFRLLNPSPSRYYPSASLPMELLSSSFH